MDSPPHFGGVPGTQVPVVDPKDLKAVWQVYRDAEMQRPGQRVAVSSNVLEQVCQPGADVQAVAYRRTMLQLIQHVAPEQLEPWTKDGELNETVFLAAAEIPMEWIGREERQGLPFDVGEFFRRLSSDAAAS